jgi:hypothetical protein
MGSHRGDGTVLRASSAALVARNALGDEPCGAWTMRRSATSAIGLRCNGLLQFLDLWSDPTTSERTAFPDHDTISMLIVLASVSFVFQLLFSLFILQDWIWTAAVVQHPNISPEYQHSLTFLVSVHHV